MKTIIWGALALGVWACDDHDHGEEEPLGEHACEFLVAAGEAVTAGPEAATAPDAGREEHRYDLTLPELTGGGHGGHVKVAIDHAEDHVFYFDTDVDLVVTDVGGAAVTPSKVTSDVDCAEAKAVITVSFGIGTYDIYVTPLDASVTEVGYVLLSAEHDHEEHDH